MLSIINISKTYSNGVCALDQVNLDIERGMFGLLGPNGAGKSTLMRTIAALQEPDQGRILLDGIDVVAHPSAVREGLGYLPQEFGVYPRISAEQLLEHMAVLKGLTQKNERKEQVAALLQQTNLYEVRKKAVSSFSGGMRQRFGIAQALLGDPRLIIVDEPTAGLDPEERNRFYNLLGKIGEQVVVLLSTHIVEDVRHLCTSMAVLVAGRIVLNGEPEVLLRKIKGAVWHKTLAKGESVSLPADAHILSQRLWGGRPQVHVLAETCPGRGYQAVEPSLEDLYFSVMAGEREVLTC